MNLPAAAVYDLTESLVINMMEILKDIPEKDLNYWKPAAERQGGGAMNTFAAIAIHTASAGRWMFLHQALGMEHERDREAEFQATASLAEIEETFQRWLRDIQEHADQLDAADLSQMPPTIRPNRPTWTRAHYVLHMIDHTGLHLGHLQIQRQLWEAERQQK